MHSISFCKNKSHGDIVYDLEGKVKIVKYRRIGNLFYGFFFMGLVNIFYVVNKYMYIVTFNGDKIQTSELIVLLLLRL